MRFRRLRDSLKKAVHPKSFSYLRTAFYTDVLHSTFLLGFSLSLPIEELVLGLLLSLSRSIPSAHETMRRGEWAKKDFNGRTLNGKILGIIGFGSVGRAVRVLTELYGRRSIPVTPTISMLCR